MCFCEGFCVYQIEETICDYGDSKLTYNKKKTDSSPKEISVWLSED